MLCPRGIPLGLGNMLNLQPEVFFIPNPLYFFQTLPRRSTATRPPLITSLPTRSSPPRPPNPPPLQLPQNHCWAATAQGTLSAQKSSPLARTGGASAKTGTRRTPPRRRPKKRKEAFSNDSALLQLHRPPSLRKHLPPTPSISRGPSKSPPPLAKESLLAQNLLVSKRRKSFKPLSQLSAQSRHS